MAPGHWDKRAQDNFQENKRTEWFEVCNPVQSLGARKGKALGSGCKHDLRVSIPIQLPGVRGSLIQKPGTKSTETLKEIVSLEWVMCLCMTPVGAHVCSNIWMPEDIRCLPHHFHLVFLKQMSPDVKLTHLTALATKLHRSALPRQLQVLRIQTQALLLNDPSLWKWRFQNKQQIKSLFVYFICLCKQEPGNHLTPLCRKQNATKS